MNDLQVGTVLYGGYRGGCGSKTFVTRVHKDTIRVQGLPSTIIDRETLRGRDYDEKYRFFRTQEEAEDCWDLYKEWDRFRDFLGGDMPDITREQFEQVKSLLKYRSPLDTNPERTAR